MKRDCNAGAVDLGSGRQIIKSVLLAAGAWTTRAKCKNNRKCKEISDADPRRKPTADPSEPWHALWRVIAPILASGGSGGGIDRRKPIKAVKILSEELVVYRDKTGRYGLVGEHCSHRLASLAYGRVDEEGIRCPYHGWKFDHAGKCLEQPAEPPEGKFKDRIKHVAYPVEYLGGLFTHISVPRRCRCCRVGTC